MGSHNKCLYLFLCIALLLFADCKQSKSNNRQASKESITIKGFKLGMNFTEAQGNALRLFEEAGFNKGPRVEFVKDHTEISLELSELRPVVISLFKDDANLLARVEMSSYATDAFFKASEVKAEDFAKELADSYRLPEMVKGRDELNIYTLWRYESKDGWFVQVNDAKYLIFGKGPIKPKQVF